MKNFEFCVPTDICFGKGQISSLAEKLSNFGKNVLLVYGGGSIKKTGLYDEIRKQLNNFTIYELSGIEPNPKVTSVRKGATICKEENIDVILAVGGGSTIDASKHIACSAFYEGDPWDLVLDRSKVTKALPIAVILTMAATGSEMNSGAVISNEETKEKLEINHPLLYPSLSICDPTYLYTLPKKQTAAAIADIMSHIFEQYFHVYDGAFITDQLSEGVMRTIIKYGPIALENPTDYEARSNMMWSSTVALNHLLTVGKGCAWSCHPIEHVLSAYYDITHGDGLAIVTPAWMRYVLCDETKHRFAVYARNVWGVQKEDDYEAALEGINKTEQFFIACGLPSKLSQVGINDEKWEEMAQETVRTSNISKTSYYPLQATDIVKIFESCA